MNVLLLDQFLPLVNPIAVEQLVDATHTETWDAIWNADISGTPFTKLLFLLRVIPNLMADAIAGRKQPPPPERLTFSAVTEIGGWIKLAEDPGHEAVFGLIGQFWKPVLKFESYPPDEFVRWSRPGFAKCAISFSVRPANEGKTILRYECRTVTTSRAGRFWFGLYWGLIRPFVGIIMRDAVQSIQREAERAHRRAFAPLLIDQFSPTFDYTHLICRRVNAAADATYRAIWETPLNRSTLVVALATIRSIPDRVSAKLRGAPPPPAIANATLRDLIGPYWVLLGERPNREVVLGNVGRVWRTGEHPRPVTPEEFADYNEPGVCKIAWSLWVESIDDTHCWICTEARTTSTDEVARRAFRMYWTWVGPPAYFTKWLVLGMMKREAERLGRSKSVVAHAPRGAPARINRT